MFHVRTCNLYYVQLLFSKAAFLSATICGFLVLLQRRPLKDQSRVHQQFNSIHAFLLPLLFYSSPFPLSLPSSPSFSFSFVLPFLPLQILLLTLRLSIPSVLRFSVCAGILYIAFMFLGWLVLGPYHTKVSRGVAGGVPLWLWV